MFYPGLASHPQHALAKKQMLAFGGMISAELNGTLDDARRFLERCQLFALAESLGGVESLIEHPALMTHGSVPADVRAALGISDTLVRLSSASKPRRPRRKTMRRWAERLRGWRLPGCGQLPAGSAEKCKAIPRPSLLAGALPLQ